MIQRVPGLVLSAAILATPAAAQQVIEKDSSWVFLKTDALGARSYIDMNNVARSGSKRIVVVINVFKVPEISEMDGVVQAIGMHEIYDCDTKTVQVNSFDVYNIGGDKVQNRTLDRSSTPISPGTISETAALKACGEESSVQSIGLPTVASAILDTKSKP